MIPWTAARQASLSITNFQSLLKLTSIESVMPSNHLILCPLLLPPSIFPSIRVFSNVSALQQSPSNEYSGLISFRIDWFDPLAVQGILKNPLQYHSSKSSILQCSAFFMVQLSQPLTSFNFHNYPSHALESPYYIDIFRMPLLWMKGENMSERSLKSPRVI